MAPPLLYSTNVFLKLLICERFAGDLHYAWCSECFDSTSLARYTLSAQLAPTSNPADIYRDLQKAVARRDRHSYKINEQRVSLKNLALQWETTEQVTTQEKQEIIYMIDNADFSDWRPLLYIIPRAAVEDRLKIVPPEKRASLGPEYIVANLKRSEFDVLEL